jgi:hypothetical protein
MDDAITLRELPDEDAPDYFRLLVRNCIDTFKELPNDALCLDYNGVDGKLRALVLDDPEYKKRTRNIYAKQRLDELREIDSLAGMVSLETDGADDPRGKEKQAKITSADKDILNMRFKAAQIRREILAGLNDNNNVSERDAVNLMFVPIDKAEFDRGITHEIYAGDADGALDELTGPKEEAPEGTSGKTRPKGQDGPLEDEDFFEVLPDGAVVEK